MGYVVCYLYEKESKWKRLGDPRKVSEADDIRDILDTQPGEIIRLGIDSDEKAFKVTKVIRNTIGDDVHIDVVVTDVSELPSD